MAVTLIVDDDHWHALRAKNVGGSDVAALFDQSPYQTRFTLWHEKAGRGERDRGNDRTEWGKRLEPAIAQGVTDDMRWQLRKSREYHTNDRCPGMGCTLDYDVVDHSDGPGIVEIKFVAEYATWKEDWSDARAPVCFELQLQHQLACTGRTWGAIALFIGQTATLKIYERKADARVIPELERRVAEFWQSIKDGKAPDVTGTAEEWKLLSELYPAIERGKTIEIEDERVSHEAQLYLYGQSTRKSGQDIEGNAKVKLLAALGDAECAKVPGYWIRQRPHGKGRVITVAEGETGVRHAITELIELA